MNIEPQKSKPKAFTLVELLIVIAIIGLLATLSVVALNSARAKARDAKRVADIRQISTALEMFLNDYGRYPTDQEWATGSLTSPDGTDTYLAVIPSAPTPADGSCDGTTNAFSYAQTDGGASYTLSFCLGNNVGNLSSGIVQNNPGGNINIGGGGGVVCLNSNTGMETISGNNLSDDNWTLRGLNTQDMSDYPASAPIKSTDSYIGNYAIEFQGSGNYASMVSYGITLNNGSNYTTRAYAKGSNDLTVLYSNNGAFWNFTLNQWDSGVNPFGADYLIPITLTSNYSEFVVPNVVGDGQEINAIFFSMNNDVFIDNVVISQDDDGNNLITDYSFENWYDFPSNWTYWKDSPDAIGELESDPSHVHGGQYSIKLTNGSTGTITSYTDLASPVNNFDLNFFSKSGNSSPDKQIVVAIMDDQGYYNCNSGAWQQGYDACHFYINDNFEEYSILNIPPPSGDTIRIKFNPDMTSGNYSWIDDVCVSSTP